MKQERKSNKDSQTGIFYRAMGLEELADYKVTGNIPANKPWAGLCNYESGFGYRVINRVTNWVKDGRGPKRMYDVLVSYFAHLCEFEPSTFEIEVYKNKIPISLDKIIIELVSPRVVREDIAGFQLSETVLRMLK